MGVDHDFTRKDWEKRRQRWDKAIIECRMSIRWTKTSIGYECHGWALDPSDTVFLGLFRNINNPAARAKIRDLYPDVPEENIILDHVEVTPRMRRWR